MTATGNALRARFAAPPLRALAAVLLALLPAAPLLPREPMRLGATEAEQRMALFSRCIVERRSRRAQAERFVRMIPEGPAFVAAGVSLATNECVPRDMRGPTQMRFPPDLFRVSLYSAMYRREFAAAPPPAELAELPPLRFSDEFDGDAAALPVTITALRTLGDCAARAEPAGTHALLLTRIGSPEEHAALDRVMPALGNCLPAGRELRFSRSMLRGALAEALYKLRKASARAPAR